MGLLPMMMMICLETSNGAVHLSKFEDRVSASTHKTRVLCQEAAIKSVTLEVVVNVIIAS